MTQFSERANNWTFVGKLTTRRYLYDNFKSRLTGYCATMCMYNTIHYLIMVLFTYRMFNNYFSKCHEVELRKGYDCTTIELRRSNTT